MKNSEHQFELKRQKMMNKMEKEISDLENQIENPRKENTKRNTIKSLKIALKIAQFTAPYILSTTITFAGFHAFGITPFYRDSKKIYLETKKEFDNLGNMKIEQQYEKYENKENTLSYYGKWENNNGIFSRNVQIYSLDQLSKNSIKKLLEQSDISSIEEVLGKPISTKTEQKNNLTNEEISSKGCLIATVYNKSTDNYVIGKESIEKDFSISLIYIILILIEGGLIFVNQAHPVSSNINNQIKNIKNQYEPIDILQTKMKLKIKKENYNRLTK